MQHSAPRQIAFSGQAFTGREQDYVLDAIQRGSLGGGGYYTQACERFLQQHLGAARVLLTSSCTSALHLAGQALGLGPGAEIIVPSYAFASCASVFVSLGAGIVFADSRPENLNLDERLVEKLITPQTRAILLIHYAGIACEMDALKAVSAKYGVPLLEDNAHGLFGTYRGQPLGCLGALSTLSFDYMKNLSCGEGGALVINDPTFAEAAEVAFQRGTNRGAFLRGQADHYEWLGSGGNYAASELQAAFLLAQLEGATAIQARRGRIWQQYQTGLAEWALANRVQLPPVSETRSPSYHLFYLLLPHAADRPRLIQYLADRGIASAFHFLPLHLAPGGRPFREQSAACTVVESASARLLRLPLHPGLSEDDVSAVLEAVRSFACGSGYSG